MKTLMMGALGLLGIVTSASAGVVVLSGGITTNYQAHFGFAASNPSDIKTYSQVTEKHYLILDATSGQYALLRLYKDGATKKVAVSDNGSFFGQVLPGDSKGKTTAYVFNRIDYSNNSYPASPGGITSTTLRLSGIANAATGASIAFGGPCPSTFTFARHRTHEWAFFYGIQLADVHEQMDQTGKLTVERALSKAANVAGDSATATVAKVLLLVNQLGYAGP